MARFERPKPMREPAHAISELEPRTNRSGENPIQPRFSYFMLTDTERRLAHGFWPVKTQHQVGLARFECSKPMREPALAMSELDTRTNRSGENLIQPFRMSDDDHLA